VARALAEEYDVIMPDARGHGKSSVPELGYRYEDHAGDVIGLIEALKLTRPVLIGHSMGGMTAALVASREPKLLGGLILADPSFLSPKVQREVRDSDVADQHRRYLSQSPGQVIDEITIDMRRRHPHRSQEIIELIARARLQTSMSAFDVLKPPNPDFKRFMSTIEIPSLLVKGDGGVVTPEVAAELQRLNPKLQVQTIHKASHGLHYDQPEQFAAVVNAFLAALPG
jgi:pimeloyl-ACP methyl ester carboxylesterase